MLRHITDYRLYRHRYTIAYLLVGLIVSVLLVAAALYVPGGLSQAEMASAANSSALSLSDFKPEAIIDLPYSLLQYASFAIFGVTTLSIKLPSLIVGTLSLIGIIFLLRNWFHENVAVISALIVITASQFIFTSQDGTPAIMYVFMSTWLLLLALKVSRQTKKRGFWEFLLVATLALSLYTPLSVYIILALASATLLHPHLRYIVGKLPRRKMIAAGVLGLILIAPLVTAIITKPEVGLTLLGIPESMPDFAANAVEIARAHLSFAFIEGSERSQSIYTLPSLMLMLLGVMHLIKTRHTARSYIIVSWILLLTPIILVNPNKTIITFVPIMLLIAAGIDVLLHLWYGLFPRNPYARVAGLLPVTLLIAGMALTGIERYFYVYRYSPPVVANFSDDLKLLDEELHHIDSDTTTLLVTESELDFYQAVARHSDDLMVVDPKQVIPNSRPLIATRSAFYERDLEDETPTKIITNGRSSESDRLYLYKTAAK